MKDWKKELEDLMNYVDSHGDAEEFWRAIADLGEWDHKTLRERIYPILEKLFQEQEEEHKKQMRNMAYDLIKGNVLEPVAHGNGIVTLEVAQHRLKALFKKYNCEDTKDAE